MLIQQYGNYFCLRSRDSGWFFFLTSLSAEMKSRSGRISVARQATPGEVESSAILSTVMTSLDLAFTDQDLSNA